MTDLDLSSLGLPPEVLADVPPETWELLSELGAEQLLDIVNAGKANLLERALELYAPYAKQLAFHKAGLTYRERLLMAGNQLGKTWSGGAEAAFHLTGRYPDWWPGRRWDRPIVGWVGGVTAEGVRDTTQRILLGRKEQQGTGMIPARDISEVTPARGIANAVDTVTVRHVAGGISTLLFKSYEKGREKWQGDTVDFVWFDEEPPADIYGEGLTRTNATGGMAWMTFTPLLGMSEVVRQFYPKPNTPDRHVTQMTIDDAEHLTPAERARIIASYPAHERAARTKGIPMLGSGRIYQFAEEDLSVRAFEIPSHWAQIGGLDFGWNHPTAAVRLAWDRDADCIYVTHCYSQREAPALVHATALKPWGTWLPWAWPHDGFQHDKGSGEQLAEQYRSHGLAMLPNHATFADGSYGVEAGIEEIIGRMMTGRFKVFEHLEDWWAEFRVYHRKDGKIVKLQDDIMSATRYAVMMLRFAAVQRTRRMRLVRNLGVV